jgi:Ca2+-binding RTX toxin-like protein
MIAPHSARPRRTLAVSILVTALGLLLPVPAQAAPPGNDAFADAIAVTEPLPFTDAQDTSEATLEASEPALGDECGFGVDHTVWYSYAPQADMVVSANTFGSDFDTVLGVWEGTDLGALTLVGCNDDRRDLQSSVVFFAEMGVEYRIQVGGYGGATGNLAFKVRTTTGGFIEGTVTDEDTTDPITGACVVVQDAAGFDNSAFALTDDAGDYSTAVRPGEYVVWFVDCDRDAYVPEYYDDAPQAADATEVTVAADTLVSGIDAALTPGCPGWASYSDSQILGTAGPDELLGTAESDVICGFGDDDTLTGGQGRDILIGGAGDDALQGAADADDIFGGAGRDSLFGGLGRDLLDGDAGHDRCNGGAGNDRLRSCETRVGG